MPRVAGDGASVHIEVGFSHIIAVAGAHHKHAGAALALGVGDLAAAEAVAEGEGTASFDSDRVKIAVGRDVVAVQAEHHAVDGFPSAGDLNVLGQVVVARPGDVAQLGNALPVFNGCMLAIVHARLAADGVRAVSRRGHGERALAAVIYQAVFAAVIAGKALRGRLADALGNHLPLFRRGHADAGRAVQRSDLDGRGVCFFAVTGVPAQIDILDRVVRDLRRAGYLKDRAGIIVHMYAAARSIAGDLAAGHVEGAAVLGIIVFHLSIIAADKHAAAGMCLIFSDRAAGHVEGAKTADKHAAAYSLAATSHIVGDRAAVQIESTAPDSHAAAVGFVTFGSLIATDRTAVHIEYGGILYAIQRAHNHADATAVVAIFM